MLQAAKIKPAIILASRSLRRYYEKNCFAVIVVEY